MKKMITAAVMGLTAAAFAEIPDFGPYHVFDVKLKGKYYETIDNKAVYIENGEKSYTNKYVVKTGTMSGLVIEGMSDTNHSFIVIESGTNSQWDAFISFGEVHENKAVEKYNDTMFSYKSSGVLSGEFNLAPFNMVMYPAFVGNFSYSAKVNLSGDETNEVYSLSYVAKGAGDNYIYDYETDAVEYMPVNSILVKFNQSLTDDLTEAYYTGTNETSSIEAAEDVLKAYVAKKAKMDEEDVEAKLDYVSIGRFF